MVNLNPGGIAGGTGVQYFAGSFDGTTFTSDDNLRRPGAGHRWTDFETGSYGTGRQQAPPSALPPQQARCPTSRRSPDSRATSLVNSFNGGDGSDRHPELARRSHQQAPPELPGRRRRPPLCTRARSRSAPCRRDRCSPTSPGPPMVPGWTATGSFVSSGPADREPSQPAQREGAGHLRARGDPGTGTITSPTFTVDIAVHRSAGRRRQASVGPGEPHRGQPGHRRHGGRDRHRATTAGTSTGRTGTCQRYQGQQAQIQVVDQNDGSTGWGHLMVGDIVFADASRPRRLGHRRRRSTWWSTASRANPPRARTARTSTGRLGRQRPAGKQASSRSSTTTPAAGGTSSPTTSPSPTPPPNRNPAGHWVDYGKDFYAGVHVERRSWRSADQNRLDE